MRPIAIPRYIMQFYQAESHSEALIQYIRKAHRNLIKGEPEVSIVVPAYNEEDSILKTLASLCGNQTNRSVEIIVVNNNSRDRTEALVKACGIPCILETAQGIAPARNRGLAQARGKYVLNADADTLYPPDWIEEMVKPMVEDPHVAVTYGKFSFIPVGATGRRVYFFYEHFADWSRFINRFTKDESVNVYGFTSGFRREQGLQVDGFNYPPGAGEDGYLALKLRDQGFGRLFYVRSTKALAWTTDRRMQIDGGLWMGTAKRLKRVLLRN